MNKYRYIASALANFISAQIFVFLAVATRQNIFLIPAMCFSFSAGCFWMANHYYRKAQS